MKRDIMGAYGNSNLEQNLKKFVNFPISLEEDFICFGTPFVGSDLTHLNGLNGSQQRVSMMPIGVPLRGINTPCYNIPPFTAPVMEQLSVSGFAPRPPIYQGAVAGQQGPTGPFYTVAVPEYVDHPHQSMQLSRCSGDGVMNVSEMGEPSKGGGESKKKNKKSIRWSKEEHKLFLIGMKKHKKGDWKSISRHFVITRSPTQVASHAQKYFSKSENSQLGGGSSFKKKRTSIHDVRRDGDDIVDDPLRSRSCRDSSKSNNNNNNVDWMNI